MDNLLMLLAVLVGLFVGVFVLMLWGRRMGVRRRLNGGEGATAGLSVVDGAVFGLLALLLGFTFSGAASRFDARRQLIGQEANAIGTTYLRIDLLPQSMQAQVRQDFRDYLDARLAFYGGLRRDLPASLAANARATALQNKIWAEAVEGCEQVNVNATTSLVLASLNDMIDITTTRRIAQETHPPFVIYWALGTILLASAVLAGFGMAESKTPNWIHIFLYSAVLAAAVYVILDLEFPRLGLIRIDAADRVLVELRSSMN